MNLCNGWKLLLCVLVFLCFSAAVAPVQGDEPSSEPGLTLEQVDQKADEAALAGHNSWMLTSTALVLFMTAPGLAMFYSGLVRKKNVRGVMMQCIFV